MHNDTFILEIHCTERSVVHARPVRSSIGGVYSGLTGCVAYTLNGLPAGGVGATARTVDRTQSATLDAQTQHAAHARLVHHGLRIWGLGGMGGADGATPCLSPHTLL